MPPDSRYVYVNPITALVAIVATLALLYSRSHGKASPKPPQPVRTPRPRPRPGRYITSSTRDRAKTVRETPAELLSQARTRTGLDITLDELTAARLIASELSQGTPEEMAAMVDAELNRAEAKGRTLTAHLTSAGTYGKQGGRHGRGKKRPASTAHDPTHKHLDIARRVIGGELRGIALGAVRFFDPVSQYAAHKRWLTGKSDRRHCHPAVILRRWTHDLPWNRQGPPCALHDKPGRQLQEWVGPIDGINPLRVMLLRPARPGDEHQQRYEQARRLILERFPLTNPEPRSH